MARKIKRLMAFLLGFAIMACRPIINKLAFFPDKTFQRDLPPRGVEEIYIRTSDNIQIQCLFLKYDSPYVLLYCHGNGGNIMGRLNDLMELNSLGINVLGLGYRGYGKSEGSPSEQGIYTDAQSAFQFLLNQGYAQEHIILFGRSIGTTAATYMAKNRKVHKLILVTPVTNAKEHAKNSGLGFLSWMAGDAFDNLSRIRHCPSPTHVLHGTEDEILPFEMGRKIFKAAQNPASFTPLPHATHNTLSTNPAYWEALEKILRPSKIE